jgi:hypothetical protein
MTESHTELLRSEALSIAAGSNLTSPAVVDVIEQIVLLREVEFIFGQASEMFDVPMNLVYQNLSNKPNVVRVRGFALVLCDICFTDHPQYNLPQVLKKIRSSIWAKTVRMRIGNKYSDSNVARCCCMSPAGVKTMLTRMQNRMDTTPETMEIFLTFAKGFLDYVNSKRNNPIAEELADINKMIETATLRKEEILRHIQLADARKEVQ